MTELQTAAAGCQLSLLLARGENTSFPAKKGDPLPADGCLLLKSSIRPRSLSLPSKRKRRICSCHYDHCVVYSLSSANKALLLSNLGRLMRLCAQSVGGVETRPTGSRGEFSQEERTYFNKVMLHLPCSPTSLCRPAIVGKFSFVC